MNEGSSVLFSTLKSVKEMSGKNRELRQTLTRFKYLWCIHCNMKKRKKRKEKVHVIGKIIHSMYNVIYFIIDMRDRRD